MKQSAAICTLILLISVSLLSQKEALALQDAPPKQKQVLISTDFGDMKVVLFDETPLHRDNFIKLVQDGFYDSLLFHRVIRNFMIQGGDPLSKTADSVQALGMGDIGYTIPAEFVDSFFHRKGALSAARTENPEKASSGCQFYIVHGQVFTKEQIDMLELQRGLKLSEEQKTLYTTEGGTPWLDKNYTVYGQVIEGLEVIDSIAAVKTRPGDRPVENIRMTMKMVDEEEVPAETPERRKRKK